MPFPSYKMALNAVTGQKSTAIYTSNLIGNWILDTGVETLYWDNQVSDGKNLRRYNGIAPDSDAPKAWDFDGSNEYLGMAADGYGGDPFELQGGSNTFALCQWFKYNNVNHILFYVGTEAEVSKSDPPASGHTYLVLEVLTSNDQFKLTVREDGGGTSTKTFDNFTLDDDTWYYAALVHDGSSYYTLYINGSYIGTLTSAHGLPYGTDKNVLEIGAKNIDGTKSFSGAATKLGNVHVYEDDADILFNSEARQNYLATKSDYA